MDSRDYRKIGGWVTLIIFVLACASPLTPTPQPETNARETFDAAVAGTAAAAQTQTSAALPFTSATTDTPSLPAITETSTVLSVPFLTSTLPPPSSTLKAPTALFVTATQPPPSPTVFHPLSTATLNIPTQDNSASLTATAEYHRLSGMSLYLFPYNLHLLAGTTSSRPLTVIDNNGNPVAGNISFHDYDTSMISISRDGYVTALRTEGDKEIGVWVNADINGVPVSSKAVIRVLASGDTIPFSQAASQHTLLYYPTIINGEDLTTFVTQYEIPTVNEYVYSIQEQFMGIQPFNGAKQIFEVDLGTSETQRVCGISGNPIRLGWNINGDEWRNCFLVPFISPRSPQSNVMYHEMGHNFTWASATFGAGLGRFEYSEGIATAISAATIQSILDHPATYPIGADATTALQQQINAVNDTFGGNFQNWLDNGSNFAGFNPDIVDGIWLNYNAQRRGDFAQRFFLPLQPQYASRLSPLMSNLNEDDQHTVFAALVSSAMGQDLSKTFSKSYHYPINAKLFGLLYSEFKQIVDARFPE